MDADEARKLTQASVSDELERIFDRIKNACSECKSSVSIKLDSDTDKRTVLKNILERKGYTTEDNYNCFREYDETIIMW